MRATGGHAHRPHLFAKTGWQAIQECVAQKCHRQGHTQQSSGLPQACLARLALQPCAGAQDKVFCRWSSRLEEYLLGNHEVGRRISARTATSHFAWYCFTSPAPYLDRTCPTADDTW